MEFSEQEIVLSEEGVTTIDSTYKPFPSFSEWMNNSSVSEEKWNQLAAEQEEARKKFSEVFLKAVEFTVRIAALDTGAIEDIYKVDRGFTFSVALQAATWETEADKRDLNIRRFFEAQVKTYELVLDAVTEETPVSEAWVRILNEKLCEPQETYRVITPVGVQYQPLPKGVYKTYPNHEIQQDGSTFAYAPVDRTMDEMQRLMGEIRSKDFEQAHPVLQASYAHYALVKIHPFADGNGRVARAFASLYLYKANAIPLVIFADQRNRYFQVLDDGDNGQFQPFVDFLYDRGVDTFSIQLQQLKSTSSPPIDTTVSALHTLYTGYRGFTHQAVDDMAYSLIHKAKDVIEKQIREMNLPSEISSNAQISGNANYQRKDGYRLPVKEGGRELILTLNSAPPAQAKMRTRVRLYISSEPKDDGELFLESDISEPFFAQVMGLTPENTKVVEVRLTIWIEKLLGQALAKLEVLASDSLRRSGYV